MKLSIYVDAAHGRDIKTRGSISGFIAFFNGTVFAYIAKWQPNFSTSSTEPEFKASVTAGKM